MNSKKTFYIFSSILFICFQTLLAETQTKLPNIIYILADDLGYGDIQPNNPEGKIPTPHLNKMAAQGMRFSDAHSNSSVCTPTRYGILTGRYAWRSRLKSGVLHGYSNPLIEKDRLTVASLLKQKGYQTACIGKWHLGLHWDVKEGNPSRTIRSNGHKPGDIDFSKKLLSGPNEQGFDYFFGISASLDMPPYVYLRNHDVVEQPSLNIPINKGKAFWRGGLSSKSFKHIKVLDELTVEAQNYIKKNKENPFFLYFPLPAPHKPIIPENRFQNKSNLNEWGDFVMQMDWTIGQIMNTLREQGIHENTILIITSDNGATPGADFPFLKSKGHNPSAKLRGHKADIFEGGHRVPFIVQWPAQVKAGSVSNETICLTDLMATAADINNIKLPDHAGEDSFSILPLLQQKPENFKRKSTIHHSINGSFAIRQGPWKLILCKDSGGWSYPRPRQSQKLNLPKIQLYNIQNDLGEQTNLQAKHPDQVKALSEELDTIVKQGRSTAGAPQANVGVVRYRK